MEYVCELCGETYDDMWLVLAHKELYHFYDINSYHEEEEEEVLPARSSVIHYAPPASELLAEALEGRVVRHYRIRNHLHYNIDEFLTKVSLTICNVLRRELERLHFVKAGLVLNTVFSNVEEELSVRGFISRNRVFIQSSDIEGTVQEILQEIVLKVTEHEGRGSGWSLLEVVDIQIRVHKSGYGQRGSSYIPLPKKIADTHSCVNLKNTDNQCFKYAMLSKFLNCNKSRIDRRYKELENKYKFNNINYPVSLSDIEVFERANPRVSVNVFGLDESNNVFPLKVTKRMMQDHTDLLILKKGDISHYVCIVDFNRLVRSQMTKSKNAITVCKRCFCFVNKAEKRGGSEWLLEHNRLCGKNQPVKVLLPTKERSVLTFNNVCHQYRVPIVVYADFESSLLPLENTETLEQSRTKYQRHEPTSYCIIIKSTLENDRMEFYGLSSKPILYRGENAAKKFLDELYDIANKVQTLYSYIVPMNDLTQEENATYYLASLCYLCKQPFSEENLKVRDHDHLTGAYRGPACNNCNINYKLPNMIPVVMHNLSGYDSHYIVPELGRDDGRIDLLANTTEKFISFSKSVNRIKLRFIDSYRFMPSSLSTLTNNLRKDDLHYTKTLVSEDKLELVLRKGVFPYDYIDSFSKFEETQLPPPEAFYNKLCDTDIEPEDYQHALNVWEQLEIETLGGYSDFYVTLDVALLCDVMEEFRNTCISAYGLDPLHYYTSPGLAWQAMMKETKCSLELLTDIDMVLLVEAGIRGGITQCVTKHVKANNKYLPDFDDTKESLYLGYFDANNLYGWAMSMPLPYGNFEWVDPMSIGDVNLIPRNGDTGYILECDFEYPETLHDHHYDLPLLPRTTIPPEGKHPKLMLTLDNKIKYVAHFWIVQQALQTGLKLTKIHRALKFFQSYWLKPYIDSNTARRSTASSPFQKDFFKLMNNAVFGKSLQNQRKHKNIRLVNNAKMLTKLVQKPNFRTSNIINVSLVMVHMNKISVKMDRPMYVGMVILDISKFHMYDFHYNKMVKYYGRNNIGVCYTDTDSFIYFVKTLDMYDDLRRFPYSKDFDFSDYPSDHPTYDNCVNKKVLGKFKDECNGVPVTEMVGLMSKMYSLKLLVPTQSVKEGVIKKAKGIKSSYVKKHIQFEHYKDCLYNHTTYTATFNSIRSFNHRLYSIRERKKSLASSDDKRKILEDGIHTLPYGHYSLQHIDE